MGDYKDPRQVRASVLRAIREFFWSQDFLEVDTPVLVPCPGMEVHIRAFALEGSRAYLPTSPEFALKKVLADGYPRIFQLAKSFRDEPYSDTHHPEFTMLEWYRSPGDYTQIMDDVDALFSFCSQRLGGGQGAIPSREKPVFHLDRGCLRQSVSQCFFENVGADLGRAMPSRNSTLKEQEEFNDWFFRHWLNDVEPQLRLRDQPILVYDYPWTQAALSNTYTDQNGFEWAKRFEVYLRGIELANAFDELCDPVLQRERFMKDMDLRELIYGEKFPRYPLDEELLAALPRIKTAGGIALGVDRFVMALAGANHIDEVLWRRSYLSR